MGTALIVYGSTTGNTENTARMIAATLAEGGMEVTVDDAANVKADGLCTPYDLILFGCSTWGDDSIELQDDFVPLLESFDRIQAQGKATAVFGCGDSSYTYFCGAVDAISEELARQGASVLDTLKIDGSPQAETAEIERWANGLLRSIN